MYIISVVTYQENLVIIMCFDKKYKYCTCQYICNVPESRCERYNSAVVIRLRRKPVGSNPVQTCVSVIYFLMQVTIGHKQPNSTL